MPIVRTVPSRVQTNASNIVETPSATLIPQHHVVEHCPDIFYFDGDEVPAHVWMLTNGKHQMMVLATGDDIDFVHQRLGTD